MQFAGLHITTEILFIQQILYHPLIAILVAVTIAIVGVEYLLEVPRGVIMGASMEAYPPRVLATTETPWYGQLICIRARWAGTKATP